MLCIQNNKTNPYFNIAAEEYVLKNFKENCFMLWRNKPSIIVGKHQNTLAEINFEYVKDNNIDLVRRLSGGGAVFHDLGNLNFTFIQNVEGNDNLVDFKKYTKPIIEVLHQLGINARFEGRNDIKIDGKKISGNAEHIFKKRVLHHGTLLFSSVMNNLSQALKVNPLKYHDKGVKSVRSRVANISDYLSEKMTVMEFRDKILSYILDSDDKVKTYKYNKNDIEQINRLVKDKYSTWEWNFGYSPKYNFEKSVVTKNGMFEIRMNVKKGFIQDIKILSDFLNEYDTSNIQRLLVGIEHEENSIRKALQKIPFAEYFHNTTINELILAMF